jgi:hypothetical protein
MRMLMLMIGTTSSSCLIFKCIRVRPPELLNDTTFSAIRNDEEPLNRFARHQSFHKDSARVEFCSVELFHYVLNVATEHLPNIINICIGIHWVLVTCHRPPTLRLNLVDQLRRDAGRNDISSFPDQLLKRGHTQNLQ